VTACAFGVIEGAVVVYLRDLTYPEGFAFPLKEMPWRLLVLEVARESATLVLLLGVAFLAERTPLRRFAVFAFSFGVWDLVYYVTLKVCLGWPADVLTWDVLFLIPVVWTGPVLAPVLVSVALVAAAIDLLARPEPRLTPADWGVEIAAGLAVLASFFWNLPAVSAGEVPRSYPWWLFLLGYGAGVLWFLRVRRKARRSLGHG
jgi:hypothetical protein